MVTSEELKGLFEQLPLGSQPVLLDELPQGGELQGNDFQRNQAKGHHRSGSDSGRIV